jgi:phosphoglycerate kinase
VVKPLSDLIGVPVKFVDDCIGEKAEKAAAELKDGEVALLENLRYYNEEEANDDAFSAKLAKLADVYVNDAFGAAHRAHSSTPAWPIRADAGHRFPDGKGAALPRRRARKSEAPFVVILGGAKVSDKIKVIDRLLDRADTILIGGAMAYTFALAQGKKIGKSLSEPDKIDTAKQALEKAKAKGSNSSCRSTPMSSSISISRPRRFRRAEISPPGEDIPDGWEGVDIGPETVKLFSAEVASAKTILWNGPMGVFEVAECAKGTFAIAKAIAANSGAISIIGGGDSVSAIKKAGVSDKVSFISTGGGASLEFLEGRNCPAWPAFPDKIRMTDSIWRQMVEFLVWPGSPQLYFLPVLFVISVFCHYACHFRQEWILWLLAFGLTAGYAWLSPGPPHGNEAEKYPAYAATYLAGILVARPVFLAPIPRGRLFLTVTVFCFGALCLLCPTLLYLAVPLVAFRAQSLIAGPVASPLDFLGRHSGAIYVWHTPIIMPVLFTAKKSSPATGK